MRISILCIHFFQPSLFAYCWAKNIIVEIDDGREKSSNHREQRSSRKNKIPINYYSHIYTTDQFIFIFFSLPWQFNHIQLRRFLYFLFLNFHPTYSPCFLFHLVFNHCSLREQWGKNLILISRSIII